VPSLLGPFVSQFFSLLIHGDANPIMSKSAVHLFSFDKPNSEKRKGFCPQQAIGQVALVERHTRPLKFHQPLVDKTQCAEFCTCVRPGTFENLQSPFYPHNFEDPHPSAKSALGWGTQFRVRPKT